MLDIKFVRENTRLVEENLKRRYMDNLKDELRELLRKDEELRKLKAKLDEMRSERNKLTKEIAQTKAKGKDVSSLIKKMKDLPEEISDAELHLKKLEDRMREILMKLPNIAHESVPKGKDDTENKEIRAWGKKPKFDFELKGHEELALDMNGLDLERAAKISGARFYFLKGPLVILHNAVLRFALDYLGKKGFTPVLPPFLMRRGPYEGVIDIADFEKTMYRVEKEDLYMIATSEHPLVAMYQDETFDAKSLPLKQCGISPCFRTEAGAHGKDTKGVFRVHQFDKVEQVVFCKPSESWKLHDELIANAEGLFQQLQIPYHIVNVCTGDLGSLYAKKYDLNAWMPTQGAYREMVSCSNALDFQARRLGIKWREGEGKAPAGFVHTLNSTAVASPRVLACILENFQREDGSVGVPKVLWGYTGFKEIEPVEA